METNKEPIKLDDICPQDAPDPDSTTCPSACAPPRPVRVKPTKERVILSWSGGKDSAMALYHLLTSQKYEVVALLTNLSEEFDRISSHGVRSELLERQASMLGIPLHKIVMPAGCTNRIYEEKMNAAMEYFKAQGVTKVVFGDLFLEDLRQYREEQLAKLGMTAFFPLWNRDTDELVRTVIQLGFKAYLCCVDGKALDSSFAGRQIDLDLLQNLPDSVDPCGEYGEYHSFVFDGPIFTHPVKCKTGEVVYRADRFYFCDILAYEETAS